MAVEGRSMMTDVIVPLTLELSISALTLAFTPAGALTRYALVPLDLYLAYCVWVTAGSHFRRSWANIIICLSADFMLQYVDIGLISRWTYEQNPFSMTFKSSNGSGRHKSSSNEASQSNTLSRTGWGFMSMLQNRRLNTAEEVKNVPLLPKSASSSRLNYTVYAFVKLSLLYLTCDFLGLGSPPDADTLAKLFAPERVPIFSRLFGGENITLLEMGLRTATVLVFWIVTYSLMDLIMLMASLAAVPLGISHPSAWRPFFGSISDAYTVRRFWGRTWHQALRNPLSKPAEWIVENIFGLKKIPEEQRLRKWLAKYSKHMLTFAFSGALHISVDSASGCGLFASGTMRYFLMQGAGIMVEDHVQALVTAANSLGIISKPTWGRALGYVWVAAFQLWTTPGWIYCTGLGASSEPKPPLPISLVGLFKAS